MYHTPRLHSAFDELLPLFMRRSMCRLFPRLPPTPNRVLRHVLQRVEVLLEERRAVCGLQAHRRLDHARELVFRVRLILCIEMDAFRPVLVVDAHDVLNDTARAL